MKSYMGTAVKEINIEAILAIMNTAELVDGPEFFSGLISTTSSVVFTIVRIAFLLQPQFRIFFLTV